MFHITPTPTSWMLWAAIYVVAVLVIWPAFITMVSGGVLFIVLIFIASVIED